MRKKEEIIDDTFIMLSSVQENTDPKITDMENPAHAINTQNNGKISNTLANNSNENDVTSITKKQPISRAGLKRMIKNIPENRPIENAAQWVLVAKLPILFGLRK